MSKNRLQRLLHSVLGFETYLLLYSMFRIARSNHYEPSFQHFLDMCPAKGNILDIGANTGMTAVPLSRVTTGSVFAFEPIDFNQRTLTKIIGFFQCLNVKIIEAAVGQYEDIITMVVPLEEGVKKQGLCKVDDNNTVGEKQRVKIITIDSLDFHDVTAIKIDVEGHEYEALKGAWKTIARSKPLIYCELWNNSKRAYTIDMIEALGYSTFVYNEETKQLDPFINQAQWNFFFVPKTN